jgi:hypothetical protein
MDQTRDADPIQDDGISRGFVLKKLFVIIVSFVIAIVSANELHGWHVYVGFAIAVAGLCIALLIFQRKYANVGSSPK